MAGNGIDEILELIRERGGRLTTPRRAIVAALLDADGHVTAEEIADRVQAAHPDVHRSTVYRTLDTLADLGVVEHVHLGHGPAVYHFTDDAHHHLICRTCGAVVEVPADVFAPLARSLRRRFGFDVDARHFALSGLCQDCS